MIESTNSPTQGLNQLCDSGKQNVEDEFLSLINRNTIQGLKDCKEVLVIFLKGLLKWIINNLRSILFSFYKKVLLLS